ncbi:MAG: DUF4142 domain-containing protein [Oxalicibacterium faecigallinarum]|uniref:DUF4142 domain-containing protein n=1 Tax=Oxalicibacterium faecigallinarum TaxID=573741 RepID=A0A8J3B0G8_9BURK|nr:DUF4142 domain-containing protein [Oxalicibacterium faecigallinarum]MDQ7970659.1 DUF4142 domain-containing protein [Oxalicibacterium faecigallinarum]GGI21241.1 hypothetical protein GCM10008066_28080 [Oxalicibacterium faecigallinarum]
MQTIRNFRHARVLGLAAAIALGGMSTGAIADQVSAAQAGKLAAAAQGAPLNATERQMLTRAAQANMAEVAAAELAKTKSSNENVLKFAQQMIKDHSHALKEITAVAEKYDVRMPKDAGRSHANALKKMNQLSADEFDRQYLSQAGVQEHKDTKQLVENLRNSSNPELKALGEKLTPVIEAHLKMANDLS